MTARHRGTIRRLDSSRVGFILDDNGEDVFLHLSQLRGIDEGMVVEFTRTQGRRGPMAADTVLHGNHPPARPPLGRHQGQIKWFDRVRGFGFITEPFGDEVFLHASTIRGLEVGGRVEYQDVQLDAGHAATDVILLTGGHPVASDRTGANAVRRDTELLSSFVTPDITFRRTTWGMSATEVQASEQESAIDSTDSTLSYRCAVAGVPATATYFFVDGRLIRGCYLLMRDSSPNLVSGFHALADLLAEKYGRPATEDVYWPDGIPLSDSQQIEAALLRGDFSRSSIWMSPRTTLRLSIDSKDGRPYVIADYRDESAADAEIARRRQRALEDL